MRTMSCYVHLSVLVTVGVLICLPSALRAQDVRLPLVVTHFVHAPEGDLARLENVRAWSFGLGLAIAPRAPTGYGLAAQATYGGPYWYLGGGVGMWNQGSPDGDVFVVGLNYNYNVFQSNDHRTRLGPQFAWSMSTSEGAHAHVFTYRAVASHALGPSLALFGGLGAQTTRSDNGTGGTDPGLSGGLYTLLADRWGWSTAVEAVFADAPRVTFSSSVQFEPRWGELIGNTSRSRPDSALDPPR